MKNRDRFKNELVEACIKGTFNVFFNERIRSVYDCEAYRNMTDDRIMLLTTLWLEEEYQEQVVDWSKVENDDLILVRDGDDEEWNRAHFAYYKNGKVYAWSGGKTSWTASSYMHWEYAKLAEPQKPEHDSCVGCEFEHFESNQEPCKDCRKDYWLQEVE